MSEKVFYVLGSTCTGKDYFIELACKMFPEIFGAIQVGKIFRQRYPADHFKGQGAPDHTEKEALEIFAEEFHKNKDKQYILVSSQPRRPSQVQPVFEYAINNQCDNVCIFMHTPHEIVMKRLKKRFINDPPGYELAIARVVNDKIQFYDTIFEILQFEDAYGRIPIRTLDTSTQNLEGVIKQLVHFGDF